MASQNVEKPNLIFILTDDQGAWAMGCSGNEEVRSPNLDRLATEGTRFDNFFCTSPVCSPARASILTGRIPSQHGVHDFLHWGPGLVGKDVKADEIRFLEGQPTYVDTLRQAGYETCLSGKWHLGYGLEPQAGFQIWNAMPYGASPYYRAPMVENGKTVTREGVYATNIYTDNALKFLDGQIDSDNPFCLHVHYTAPHSPWGRKHHPPELWEDYYNNCSFNSIPSHKEPLPTGFWARSISEDGRRRALSGYFAAITAMDRGIGRIMNWLEEKDLRKNTLIVFMSDNGMNMGHHGVYGKGNATWPQNMFDTSVKIPCIISRPGFVPQNRINTSLLSQYDWFPTLLEYIGLGDQFPQGLPGRSFSPLLEGKTLGERENIVVFDEYGPVRMIRSRDWKLVWRYPGGPHELYNLIEDPAEKNNLFNSPGYADKIKTMRQDLEEWYSRYVDPRLDGMKLPVTGRGQKARAGEEDAFAYRFFE
ncbi:MAG: sulfatase-like hydrolase/transferase [Promethearchaeota archaeon]|jgi:arylsulfatase A-like enzyme